MTEMPNGTTRDVAYRDCPCCGNHVEGAPYDIGSGPELCCPNCETCFGAEGQNLNPADATSWISSDPERLRLMLAFTRCQECGKNIASRWTAEHGAEPVEKCEQHQ